jgi:aspartyl protease family protein
VKARLRAPRRALVGTALALLVQLAAAAQGVALAGRMGERALLLIDGQPHTIAAGQAALGVRFLRWQDDSAVVERDGSVHLLRLGASPSRLGAAAAAPAGREIVIPAASGGHFITSGSVNGHSVQFMVDTGATLLALGRDEALRLGLDLEHARAGVSGTANGSVAVHFVTLSRVRVGEVEVANVNAMVVPASMPYVLLGNSFLARFQMQRENDIMRLQLR